MTILNDFANVFCEIADGIKIFGITDAVIEEMAAYSFQLVGLCAVILFVIFIPDILKYIRGFSKQRDENFVEDLMLEHREAHKS